MDIYWLRNILLRFIIQVLFLLKKVLSSIFIFILPFKHWPNKPQKGFALDFFVKGHKVGFWKAGNGSFDSSQKFCHISKSEQIKIFPFFVFDYLNELKR